MNEGTDSDRIDQLISAAMDDELDAAERAEFDALLASDPEVAARVRAFHRVDSELRNLGTDAISAERLAAHFESLRFRLDAEAPRSPWRHPALPFVVATAAALAIYLAVPTAERVPLPSQEPLATSIDSPAEQTLPWDEPLDEEMAVALGYGEAMEGISPVPGVSMEDFEIIEDLDLLDYLAQQESEGQG